MIQEYALEPELVATWGSPPQYRFFMQQFGGAQGRLVSRYPKKWAQKVWDSFSGGNDLDRTRLVELLRYLQTSTVQRKNPAWDDSLGTWLENAVREHRRYPFRGILARHNPDNRPEVIIEDALTTSAKPQWDNPHGMAVHRKAEDMAAAVEPMLACCSWVRFVDPYISSCKRQYRQSLAAFLKILAAERPVGPPKQIEVHTNAEGASRGHLHEFFRKILPAGLQVAVYLWRERANGQRLHNRYILTDLGGVSFPHGLDCGHDGETDDLTRLDSEQYSIRCDQYCPETQDFEAADAPIEIGA